MCIFCKIVNKELKSYVINESNDFLAFLDIFPSVRGQALVIPKKHFPSYVFQMDNKFFIEFMSFTQKTALLMDKKLPAIRTCMVMEGMEVDHAHIKLYPILEIGALTSKDIADLNIYPGYITTLHGKIAQEDELVLISNKFL